ncbi:hypothetical protein ACJX0J_008924, partial [Zea mays]
QIHGFFFHIYLNSAHYQITAGASIFDKVESGLSGRAKVDGSFYLFLVQMHTRVNEILLHNCFLAHILILLVFEIDGY